MGTGGILVPPPDYFAPIEEICKRHDVLLILDEVVTGFGRTGKWFGMQHWNIQPDLVSLRQGHVVGLPAAVGVGGLRSDLRDHPRRDARRHAR